MARVRSSHSVDRAAAKAFAQGATAAAELARLRSQAAREAKRLYGDPWMPAGGATIVEGPVEKTAKGLSTSYGANDSAAHLKEFGSVNNSPRRPLTRAAQSLGLKVTDA